MQCNAGGTHIALRWRTMMPIQCTTDLTETIGKLCVGGDWACAHGDFSGLRHVAQQLAAYAPETIQCELAELATACTTDPDRAAALWDRLKNQVYREARMSWATNAELSIR